VKCSGKTKLYNAGDLLMKIEYLCDNIHFAETVAKWIYNEFIAGIRDGYSYDDCLAKRKNCHKEQLPIILIAIDDDRCIGTISLVANDLKCRDYTPWLAGLYVDPQFRNKGVGEQLIERVKEIARQLGYKELYLRTEHASGYYKKLGWEFIENCQDDFNLKPDVFRWVFDV